ncbi:MAG TPA: hypothetical protein VH417_11425 [Vicinamibacterales bacterium]
MLLIVEHRDAAAADPWCRPGVAVPLQRARFTRERIERLIAIGPQHARE